MGQGSLSLAQTGDGPLEEVIVTAQKRAQNIQDIGISMSALDAEQLKARVLQTLPDITNSISNVELFEDYGGHGLPVWVIRGVGLQDFNPNNTPTAAVYVDDVYQVSTVMGAVGLFDAERVEVLKGPQGGLYGRNTSGGAVNLRTRRPSLDANNGYVSGTYGSWETYDFEAAGNLLLSDTAALRVAGNRQFSNAAWQRSLVDGRTWGEKDVWNFRTWLLFEPTDATRVQWKVYGGENNSELNLGRSIGMYDANGDLCAAVLAGVRDDDTCYNLAGVAAIANGQTPVLPSVQAGDGSTSLSQPINALNNDYAGSTLIVEHDFDAVSLTSITNAESFTYGATMDFDGTPLELGHNLANSDIEVWSQEVRLTSAATTPLSWILGTYLSRESFTEDRQFLLRDSIVSELQLGELGYDQRTDSFAVYGNLDYQLAEDWTVNTSVRYTNEEKNYRNGTVVAPLFPPPNVLVSDLRSDYKLASNLTGNVGLNWRATDAVLFYGSVSRGFKAGGFYGGFPLNPGGIVPYKEETVLAYEVGFKSQLADNVILNGAAFYYDYRDVQGYINQFSEITGESLEYLSNQGDARHQGLELELLWALTSNLSLTASAGHLDAKINDSKANTINLMEQLVAVEGRRPYAPKWSAYVGMQYMRELAGDMQLAANLDYSYRSDFAGDLSSPVDRAVTRLDGYGLVNGSVFLTPADKDWSVGLWCKNIGDEEYVPRVVLDSFGDFMDIPGEPRSWGLKVERSW